MVIRVYKWIIVIFMGSLISCSFIKAGSNCRDTPGTTKVIDEKVHINFHPYRFELLTADDAAISIQNNGSGDNTIIAASRPGEIKIELKGALDLTGHKAIDLDVESPGGSLELAIGDCLDRVWRFRETINQGSQTIQISLKEFSLINPELSDCPPSLEKIQLSFAPVPGSAEGTPFSWKGFRLSGSLGVVGPTMSIDPVFKFYRETPWPETAELVKATGMTNALVVFTREIEPATHHAMLKAFHESGLTTTFRVNPPTDFEAWEERPDWRQRMIDGTGRFDWRVYCCPNNPEFAAYYISRIAGLVRDYDYDALLLSEMWFEVWGGAYSDNDTRGKYACLCDHCRREFEAAAGVDPAELFDQDSPRYFEKPENQDAYNKWVEFRVDSINTLGRRMARSAREARPGIKIGYMFLSDATVDPGRTREFQAQDLDGAIMATGADFVVIQDAWQDWTEPDLQPDFARVYAEAYLSQIQKLKPALPVMVHADVGSREEMKRSGLWMRQTAAKARESGLSGAAYYEFTLNLDKF